MTNISTGMTILRHRIEEAKRALRNICHHINCRVDGMEKGPNEPESCFQGDDSQPGCLRIKQQKRIANLKRRLETVKKEVGLT